MTQPIRRLTKQGIEEFRGMLVQLRAGGSPKFSELRKHATHAVAVTPTCNLRPAPKSLSRLDAGTQLREDLAPLASSASESEILGDVGLWSWLSLAWIDAVTASGKKVGRDYRHIPEPHPYRLYRHLLRTPYLICSTHAGHELDALAALCNPIHTPGELNEQVASRQEFLTNLKQLRVATTLYVDTKSGRPKVGTGTQGSGGIRRLGEYFERLELTFDLGGMDSDEILALLPHEFDRFRLTPPKRRKRKQAGSDPKPR